MEKNYCVIIDAFSSSAFLAPEFIKRGYGCIHVTSPGEKGSYYKKSFHPEDFDLIIDPEMDLESIIARLSELPVVCIVAGSDMAGVIADTIASRMNLAHNVLELSTARRYKDHMADRLAQMNLPHIAHLKSNISAKIIEWADTNNLWPIIIKPADGAASEGLVVCQKANQVDNALENLLGKQSFLGHHYNTALAQPFLQGTEYIVNTVSCDGHHHVTDIWQYKKVKVNDKIIYDNMTLLPSDGAIQKSLIDYMMKVNDAVGIRVGPVHAEVMFTAKGPILIEVNCRVMGFGIPDRLMHEALEPTQVSLTPDAYVNPKLFFEYASKPYTLKKHMVCVQHQVLEDNAYVNESALPLINELPSFRMHKFSASGALPRTIDLLTAPGWVLLIHEDPAVITADIQRIREIEAKHLFINRPK